MEGGRGALRDDRLFSCKEQRISDVAEGTSISALANIIFDKNAPILAIHISEMHGKLDASSKMRLYEGISALKDVLHRDLPLGSFLSGTEVQFFCWKLLCEHWADCFGEECRLKPSLEFAVECELDRQRWINEYAKPVDLFACVHRCAEAGTGPASLANGGSANMRDVVHVTFGIECDSISSLGAGWPNRLDCVAKDKERTGKSAVSCLQIIFTKKIPSWLAECV